MQPPRPTEAPDLGAAVSESRSWMGGWLQRRQVASGSRSPTHGGCGIRAPGSFHDRDASENCCKRVDTQKPSDGGRADARRQTVNEEDEAKFRCEIAPIAVAARPA